METEDEEQLQETVERLQKNEIKQVWQELFRPFDEFGDGNGSTEEGQMSFLEAKQNIIKNRLQINNHIS